jgi:hypothetical protein
VEHKESVPLNLTAAQKGIRLDLSGLLAPPDSLVGAADSAGADTTAAAGADGDGRP